MDLLSVLSSSTTTSVDSDQDDAVPQRKRQKYYCSYQSSWESEEGSRGCVRKSKKGSNYVFCTFCSKDIKISCGEANVLSRHSETALHQRSKKAVTTTPNIATFMAANTS